MSQDKGTESTIRNTTAAMKDPVEATMFLLNQLGAPDPGDPTEAITAMEAAGQRELVNSDRLPTDAREGDEPYKALGFTFGAPDAHDPLFRPANLPLGWTRKATDHSMWSKLVDEVGRERVEIFYKAAFYDRSAFMRLTTPFGYLSSALYTDAPVVLDEVWLTRDIAVATLTELADREDKDAVASDEYAAARNDGDPYWTGEAAKGRARAEKARALAASL
jgi:hypothetical protein